MRGNFPATDSYDRIEAGPDMRGPPPARHRAFPLWTVRAIFAGIIMMAVLGASAPARVSVWVGVAAVIAVALLMSAGLRARKV